MMEECGAKSASWIQGMVMQAYDRNKYEQVGMWEIDWVYETEGWDAA